MVYGILLRCVANSFNFNFCRGKTFSSMPLSANSALFVQNSCQGWKFHKHFFILEQLFTRALIDARTKDLSHAKQSSNLASTLFDEWWEPRTLLLLMSGANSAGSYECKKNISSIWMKACHHVTTRGYWSIRIRFRLHVYLSHLSSDGLRVDLSVDGSSDRQPHYTELLLAPIPGSCMYTYLFCTY